MLHESAQRMREGTWIIGYGIIELLYSRMPLKTEKHLLALFVAATQTSLYQIVL